MFFKALFNELIRILAVKMVITAEHMIFLNDNDIDEDDDIAEYEEKNK